MKTKQEIKKKNWWILCQLKIFFVVVKERKNKFLRGICEKNSTKFYFNFWTMYLKFHNKETQK